MDVPKPRVVEDRDVILKVTGSTVCGSDLHLLHGSVVEMEKGDILGHEFCGVVESFGPGVKNVQQGDRVVASFQSKFSRKDFFSLIHHGSLINIFFLSCLGSFIDKFPKMANTYSALVACGDCFFCKQKLSSQCEKTNSNTLENGMYGGYVYNFSLVYHPH